MNRRQALTSLAAGSLAAAPARPAAWKNAFAERLRQDLLGHWQSERDYSLAIVGAMPDAKFNYRPTPEVRTFGEQAVHFGRAQAGYFSRLELLEAPKAPAENVEAAAVKAYVTQTFDYVRQVLEKVGETEFLRRDVGMGANRALHTTQDLWFRAALHTAHHRGQLIVYLRLNGIAPPDWQFAPQGG